MLGDRSELRSRGKLSGCRLERIHQKKAVRKVVYTAVTDGYELHPVINRRDGWDFVCYAESPREVEGWQVVPIESADIVVENGVTPQDKSKTTKRIKLLPHEFVRDYDVSIWIDSSLQFKQDVDLEALCSGFEPSGAVLRVRAHPYRRCIYDEAVEIVKCNLDTRPSVDRVVTGYRRAGFPEQFGLAELCFLLRKHNDARMVEFSETWWGHVRDMSRRDQLSFTYVLWKNPIDVEFIDDRIAPQLEGLSRGRDRGPFFNATFNYYPTRGR